MKLGIIGCGKMGQALLKGIISKNYLHKRDILVSDKDREKLNSLRLRFKVNVASSNSELFKQCNVIILAVKPQDVVTVIQEITYPLKGKLLVSVCAGITTKNLEGYLGRVAVVRVMPNMPACLAQGISAISLGRYATANHKKQVKSIFSSIGEVVEVKEHLMDAVTALSGSGPAYFFFLAESLIKAAEEMGISRSIARRLVIKTALGSAILMQQSGLSPEVLREMVASKGGTTEAAFRLFNKLGLGNILRRGVQAAAKRSKELRESALKLG